MLADVNIRSSVETHWLRAAGDPTVLHAFLRDGRPDWWRRSRCGRGPGVGPGETDASLPRRGECGSASG